MQCDGKRPFCSQCIHTRRQCEGYPDVLFVQYNKTSSRPIKPAQRSLKRTGKSISQIHTTSRSPKSRAISRKACQASDPPSYPLYRVLPDALQDTISLVVRSYIPSSQLPFLSHPGVSRASRICGCWMEVLPDLACGSVRSETLPSAIKALALSISTTKTGRSSIYPLTTHYGHTLGLLRRELQSARTSYQNEHVAAIMCLALSEVL